ncbi:MAG: UDP-2,3-diacylglucosamine diphosphatase [Gammaproteobacteria bacterium]|nr:UDP-2,3-diacylglucosamine diphosphatase [Gammaproteobacteria bacterium]
MATYIIADLHLSVDTPERVSAFVKFLSDIADDAEALYILGDFFEVWLGDDAIPPQISPLLGQIKNLSACIPVYFQAGNRDFLVGERFLDMIGAKALSETEVIMLYGKEVLLLHGDLLCTDDLDYMAFRQQVRNPQWIAEFLQREIAERIAMATQARAQSRMQNAEKSTEIMDANTTTVLSYLKQSGVQRMIHGHTHRPAIHEFKLDEGLGMRAVVGDWLDKPSYIRLTQEAIELHDPRLDTLQCAVAW